MDNSDLSAYKAVSGRFVPVWTLEIQTLPEDVDKILDGVLTVHPLAYGRYQRNASVSAPGVETSRPAEETTTALHKADFQPGQTESYPMVELKISIERHNDVLAKVMDVIHYLHHYEEPVIFLREDWVSRSNYTPDRDNPNRWWNNGRGMPDNIEAPD